MNQIDPNSLGKIILLQSTIHVMQDDEALMRFACRGFGAIAPIDAVGICIRGKYYSENPELRLDPGQCDKLCGFFSEKESRSENFDTYLSDLRRQHGAECLKIETAFQLYGLLLVKTSSAAIFDALKPYLENSLNLIALIIENNLQKQELFNHKQNLEQLVEQRTVDLEKSVEMLRLEIEGHRKTEKALSESESFVQHIIETTPNLVYIYDLDKQNNVYANREVTGLLGYSKQQLLSSGSKILGSVIHPEDLEAVAAHHKRLRTASAHQVCEITFRIRHADGSWRWLLSRDVPFQFSEKGSVTQILGIATDITEQKRSEATKQQLEEQLRQSQKMEAIGTLAGGIAHDFNNMLGIIIGNTELAMDVTPDWHPSHVHLEEIKTAGFRAKDVVRQLLSFSRKTADAKKTISIGDVVKESIKLLRSSIASTIDIRLEVPDRLAAVNADATQIHQVLINLCTNAAHAMEENGGILEIGLRELVLDSTSAAKLRNVRPGRYVQLAIKDSGHGIPEEILDRIFDPYFTTKEVGKGTGMGLAVVHGIVNNHDGAISVESTPERGTTFSILFPASGKAAVAEALSPTALPLGKERILLVDDEPSLLLMASRMLQRLGYEVEAINDPVKALAVFLAAPNHFHLLITDMTMPHMTGVQLAKEIFQIRKDMPIILCTGYSERMSGDVARSLGIRQYVEKPFYMPLIARAVRAALDGDVEANGC